MDTTELLNLFRVELRDQEQPYLYADETIYAYINAAQVEFCRLTEGIEDGRSFKLNIAPGTEWYPINKRILKLRKAYRADTGRPVEILNQERTEQRGVRFDGRTGPLKALVAGIEKSTLRAWPIPDETVEVVLDVFRLPKQDISGPDDECEVDDLHVPTLMHYALYRAYSRPDPDTMDRVRSQYFREQFDAACVRATREQGRARKPNHVTVFSW